MGKEQDNYQLSRGDSGWVNLTEGEQTLRQLNKLYGVHEEGILKGHDLFASPSTGLHSESLAKQHARALADTGRQPAQLSQITQAIEAGRQQK